MIRVDNLMIGDWLLDGDSYAQVTSIACGGIIETTASNFAPEEVLQPIPLTAEILERNFEKYNDNYIFSDDFFCFEIHEYNDGMWMLSYEINEMSLPNTQIANICYVHELQHLLRLCGLNELADNFKMEE